MATPTGMPKEKIPRPVKILHVYLKEGNRIAEYDVGGETEEDAVARARIHTQKIVEHGFIYDHDGDCVFEGPHKVEMVRIKHVPAGEYKVKWLNV